MGKTGSSKSHATLAPHETFGLLSSCSIQFPTSPDPSFPLQLPHPRYLIGFGLFARFNVVGSLDFVSLNPSDRSTIT